MATESTKVAMLAKLLSPRGRRARLTVFSYHQVLESPDELRVGEPTSEEFDEDLRIIAAHFNVLPMSRAVSLLAAGELPDCAATITFDDGYRNNYSLAAPLLEKHGLSATIYVATGPIDAGIMWNDLIIDAIAGNKTARLEQSLDNCGHETGTLDQRRARVREIIQRLKYRPIGERWEAAESFYRTNSGAAELPRLMMNEAELRDLTDRGFEIGAHTIHHPILATLSSEEAREEIAGSRAWLEGVIGSPPRHFAYPNGRPGTDYLPRDAELVREAGFDSSVTTVWGAARPGVDLMQIPRVGAWWRQGRSPSSGQIRNYVKSYLPS